MSISRPAQTTQHAATSDRGRPITIVDSALTKTQRLPVPDSVVNVGVHARPERSQPRGGQ